MNMFMVEFSWINRAGNILKLIMKIAMYNIEHKIIGENNFAIVGFLIFS